MDLEITGGVGGEGRDDMLGDCAREMGIDLLGAGLFSLISRVIDGFAMFAANGSLARDLALLLIAESVFLPTGGVIVFAMSWKADRLDGRNAAGAEYVP